MALTRTNTTTTINTPVATTTATATITATSLVLIGIAFEDNNANAVDAATPITVSGTAMTWTKVNDNAPSTGSTRCAIRQYAAISSGAGSRTFTHTKANALGIARQMMVSVIEGAPATVATAIPSGNRFSTTTNAAAATRSITPAGVGSMLFGNIGDWGATNSFVASAGNTIGTPYHSATLMTAVTAEPTTQPLASGAAFTWGATTTSGLCTYAVVEIVPSGAAAATSFPPFRQPLRIIGRR